MIKQKVLILIINLALALIQVSFLSEIFGPTLPLNLAYALTFSFLIINQRDSALYSGFISGIFLDLLGSGVVGLSSVIFVVGILLTDLVKRYVLNNIFSHLVLFSSTNIVYLMLFNYAGKVNVSSVLFSCGISLVCAYMFSYLSRNILNERQFI